MKNTRYTFLVMTQLEDTNLYFSFFIFHLILIQFFNPFTKSRAAIRFFPAI